MSGMDGLDPTALLLGRADRSGFVVADRDSHVLTIAPNRSGRVQHCLIPNLLTYPGRIVAVDLGGQAYAATAEARRRMGHTVVRLDPFGVTGPETDALDPLDLLDGLEEPALATACHDLAGLLPLRPSFGDVVEAEAFGLLSGLIGYHFAVPEKRSFDEIHSTLNTDDVVYSLAVVLDTAGGRIRKTSYEEIASFLRREEKARDRILARLTSQFTALGNPEVRRTLRQSTVSLADLAAGQPVTVYLILPVEQLEIHAVLLRLWIGTLLHRVSGSRGDAVPPALFLLDHTAELGPFPLLDSVLRTGAERNGYRIWTFWHDLHQLRATYPGSWPAIVSGSGAVQVFGTSDAAAASEVEDLLGLPANEVWSLGPEEQLVRLDAVRRVGKLDPEDGLLAG
ncbi:type IV secretory system conjugative DNA transfer family protein [Streptacidiphilus sp. N1-12]|uniref:Type IV secretory system conjugative DNA transfer family protein n=2 Tax=Streptacidiphilus alkalitolerans TaxID=3342712 RepID=A0ABV6W9K9_9ACTN